MSVDRSNPGGEIGGYFGLAMPEYALPFGQVLTYQSARAACHAVLQASGLKRVFIPSYVCDSIVLAARNAGLETHLYKLDEAFLPKGLPAHLPQDTGVIYVNYFGLSQHLIQQVLDMFPASKVLIDQSQALFAPECGALAEIYSPRKFVGLPDGGFARTTLPIEPPPEVDDGSIDRLRHLYRRFAYSARDGYADFNTARLSLSDTTPKAMSRLTGRMLHTVDWQDTAQKRHALYNQMANLLGASNNMPWQLQEGDAPLCYPYTRIGIDMAPIRQRLADDYDIFTATYWPDVVVRAEIESTEEMMTKSTLFLPVDQRMTPEQITYVSDTVLTLLK